MYTYPFCVVAKVALHPHIMYSTHRGMVGAPNSRLSELLDQLRQEFETQSRNTGEFEHQCKVPALLIRIFRRRLIKCVLGDSDRPASGNGNDSAKGLSAGAGSIEDEARVSFPPIMKRGGGKYPRTL